MNAGRRELRARIVGPTIRRYAGARPPNPPCQGGLGGSRNSPVRGFALAETLISVGLVGGLLVVALDTVGAVRVGQQKMGYRAVGQLLAQDLMSEILQQAYEEPVDPPGFGREASESGGSRADYDDVDDYHDWSSSPPAHKDGTALPGLTAWRRNVTVENVSRNLLTQPIGGDQGAKRITVTVTRDDVEVATLVAVRTANDAW